MIPIMNVFRTSKFIAACLSLLAAVTIHAFEHVLVEKGRLILEDDFNSAAVSHEIWANGKKEARIETRNGQFTFVGSKSADSGETPGLSRNFDPPIGDFVLEFKVTPGPDSIEMNIVFNDDHGHCLVVKIQSGMMYCYKYVERDRRSFPEYVDCTGLALEQGRTYPVTLEKAGSQMFLHIDEQHFLMGQNARFTNPMNRFAMSFLNGKGQMDDLKLWEGSARSGADLSRWSALQSRRPVADLGSDPKLKEHKRIADARQQLKTDATYQKLLLTTNAVYEDIQRRYPFFRSAKAPDIRKHKEAAKADATYGAMLRKLADHEKIELDYINSRFPPTSSGNVPKSSN